MLCLLRYTAARKLTHANSLIFCDREASEPMTNILREVFRSALLWTFGELFKLYKLNKTKTFFVGILNWESFPVLIRTQQAFQGVLDLEKDVLQGAFVARGDKRAPPYRNIRLLQEGRFNTEAETWAHLGMDHLVGKMIGPAEVKRAIDSNCTLQMYGAQAWYPKVGRLCLELSDATGLPTNVNVYITPGGLNTSLLPHNDFTCNFMIHLAGKKRWRLWKIPDFWLPVNEE
jgi:hypothetical protein